MILFIPSIHLQPIFLSYRNLLIDLICKSIGSNSRHKLLLCMEHVCFTYLYQTLSILSVSWFSAEKQSKSLHRCPVEYGQWKYCKNLENNWTSIRDRRRFASSIKRISANLFFFPRNRQKIYGFSGWLLMISGGRWKLINSLLIRLILDVKFGTKS